MIRLRSWLVILAALAAVCMSPGEPRAENAGDWRQHLDAGLEAEARDELPAALASYQAAVVAARTIASTDVEPLVTTLNKLASIHVLRSNLYALKEEMKSAEEGYREALSLQGASAKPSPNLSETLSGLAAIRGQRDDFREAERLYKRAIEIDEQIFDAADPRRTRNLTRIGDLYLAYGKIAHSAESYVGVLRFLERVRGRDHLDLVEPMTALAAVAFTNDQPGQAVRLYQMALLIQEKNLGPDHCDLRRTLWSLASIMRATGSDDEAKPIEKRADALRQKCPVSPPSRDRRPL